MEMFRIGIGILLLLCNEMLSNAQTKANTSMKSIDTLADTAFDSRTFKFESSTRTTTKVGFKPKTRRKSEGNNGMIIFPEETTVHAENILENRNAQPDKFGFKSCPNGLTFCDKVTNYPKDILRDILKRNQIKVFSTNDIIPDSGFKNRIGTSDRGQSFCDSSEYVAYPQKGVNKNGVWKFIVNVEDKDINYTQGVRVEVCRGPGQACYFYDDFNPPPQYQLKCEQKFIYRQLKAFNNESGKLEDDHFKIPSCCSCVLHTNFAAGLELRNSKLNEQPLALTASPIDNE